VPVVSTAHLGAVSSMPSRVPGAGAAFDRVVGGYIIARSDHVVAVSDSVSEHVVSHLGAAPEKVTVARNGVDRARFHPGVEVSDHPWLQVVLVGRLIATKGPLLALDAVAEARATGRDIRLQILGDGPLLSAVRRRCAEPDLLGSVEILGSVDDVERWLRRADVALRPSFTEGLPLAVLEALASGTPVICTDVAGNLDAVTDESNGLVVSVGNTAALGAALIRVHDDRAMLARMSREAVTSAQAFSWEASTEEHLRAMQRVTGCITDRVAGS